MTAIVFDVPRPAYRLSCVADRLREILGIGTFARLLRDLNPERFERLRNKDVTPYIYMVNLVNEIDLLFPLDSYTLDYVWQDAMELPDGDDEEQDLDPDLRAIRNLEWMGIPYMTYGFGGLNDESNSPDTALLCLAVKFDTDIWGATSCKRFQDDCARRVEQHGVAPLPRTVSDKRVRPPRGRVWTGAWAGVSDALRWVKGDTGYGFLDYSNEMGIEYGLPPWNIEEIRSLARQWKEAKPILERVHALIDHVDAAPEERLPILRGILAGEADALRAATRAANPKTLSEVWA